MPRVPTPLPGVKSGDLSGLDDPWAMADAPETTQVEKRWSPGPLTLGLGLIVVVALSVGAGLYVAQANGMLNLDIPFFGSRVVEPVAKAPVRTWTPTRGPLTDGLEIGSDQPSTLGWSEDGTQLGWKVYDPARGARVTWVVEVGETYGEPEVVRPAPLWVAERRGPVSAAADAGLLVLTDAITRRTELLDPRDLLGVVDSQLAVATVREGRVLVAFVARPELTDGAGYKAHVLDVTELLRPPPPPEATVEEPDSAGAATPDDAPKGDVPPADAPSREPAGG